MLNRHLQLLICVLWSNSRHVMIRDTAKPTRPYNLNPIFQRPMEDEHVPAYSVEHTWWQRALAAMLSGVLPHNTSIIERCFASTA